MSYERLDKYLEDHLPELLEDLAQLVSINSEKAEAEDEMPFGRGNAACSATAAKIAEKCGLKVRNYENYVVTADLAPDKGCGYPGTFGCGSGRRWLDGDRSVHDEGGKRQSLWPRHR